MKITVFGATGTIGSHIVEQALAQGHDVRAVARRPEALALKHENLTRVAADVLSTQDVAAAVAGSDAVLICLGSKKLTGRLRSEGTRNVVQAMKAHGVSRLICQTTLGAGSSRENLNFYWKHLMFGLLLRGVYKDHLLQETLVQDSALDWTIVRPAAFVDTPRDAYKHGFGATETGLSLTIARSDVAKFMLAQLGNGDYLHKTPGLSY